MDDFDQAVRDVLQQYDEVYAVRRGLTQAFDRLIFDASKGRAELHIDMCCPLNTEELTHIAEKYREKVNEFADAYGVEGFLQGPKNLFSKIEDFYNTTDGTVISLGHATGTKSVKEERMRQRNLDLRTELFHEHGIKAIKSTDAFAIKKGWKARDGHVPSIQIPGHFSMAGAVEPIVSYAVLENCMTQNDFNSLVKRLW